MSRKDVALCKILYEAQKAVTEYQSARRYVTEYCNVVTCRLVYRSTHFTGTFHLATKIEAEVHPKCRYLHAKLHDVTFQKAILFT